VAAAVGVAAGLVMAAPGVAQDTGACETVSFGAVRLVPWVPRSAVVPVSIPAGAIRFTHAVSADGYPGREAVTQTSEIWEVHLLGAGGTVLGRSQPTGDLPDRVQDARWEGSLGSVVVTEAVTGVVAVHRPDVVPDGSPNSVIPVGVTLCWTSAPTTTAPAAPTTTAPTTTEPTAVGPTTTGPTITEPTAVGPTTTAPTTTAPTTTEPTAVAPTTTGPTTSAPTFSIGPPIDEPPDDREVPTTTTTTPATVTTEVAGAGITPPRLGGGGLDLAPPTPGQVAPAPPPRPTPATGGPLPVTGSPTATLALAGMASAAVGLVLVAEVRRRRPVAGARPEEGA
jgi:hypothetical protein